MTKDSDAERVDDGQRLDDRPSRVVRGLSQVPSQLDGDVYAVDMPALDTERLLASVAGIQPRGVERGLARWQRRLPGLLWNDAALEGSPITLPDVTTLLDAGSVGGYNESDINQVLDLSDAADVVEQTARTGPTDVSDALSSRLNAIIAAHEILEPGVLRGEGNVGGETVVSARGVFFVALPGGVQLRTAFTQAVTVANALSHPVARAVAWAAYAAYHQFYANGNKRTARYVMNAVLLSHGYDAIVTPVARKEDYNRTLQTMYITSDATDYALFLVGLFDDGH